MEEHLAQIPGRKLKQTTHTDQVDTGLLAIIVNSIAGVFINNEENNQNYSCSHNGLSEMKML